jgi:membrane protein involved in colicin uptake
MAIESDIQGADARLAVTFYKRSMKQEDESIAAGRPIFKEFDFVRICVPGDGLTEIDTYAQDSHKQRFPRQWAHYQNQVAGQEVIIGTPIEQWPLVSRSQADELKGIKFRTVEDVANCSDQQLQRIGMIAGMSPHSFREKAKAFLNLASESAEVAQREAELQALREENDKIKAETEAKLAAMQEQMSAILAAVAEKKPKTRKPKVVEA